jgi:Ca-activated chloride channel family protein
MVNYVNLQCVKDGGKLRVKIITSGYNNNANCQFPRAIRADGKMFRVRSFSKTTCDNLRPITSIFKFYGRKKTPIGA